MHAGVVSQAVSLLIIRHDMKVLSIARRDDDEDFGLPGGKVDPGESFVDAVKRETYEESGVRVENPIPMFTACCRGRSGKIWMTTTFVDAQPDLTQLARQQGEGRLAWAPAQLLTLGSYGAYNLSLFRHIGLHDMFNSQMKGGPIWELIDTPTSYPMRLKEWYLPRVEDI